MPIGWNVRELVGSPFYADLIALTDIARWPDWPGADQLNALLGSRPLRFALHRNAGGDGAAAYEAHIAERREIPLRPHNWHDLFNALMWALFPATKKALNAVHVRDCGAGRENRSTRRDAVTLLDECGVILAVADTRLTRLHTQHRWKALFVEARGDWGARIAPLIIGHGLYEQCLRPYVGLTAKALHVSVPPAWFAQPLAQRYREVDTRLAAAIDADAAVMATRELLPLPILGVPGWWAANRAAQFYDNHDYFRPRSPKKTPGTRPGVSG